VPPFTGGACLCTVVDRDESKTCTRDAGAAGGKLPALRRILSIARPKRGFSPAVPRNRRRWRSPCRASYRPDRRVASTCSSGQMLGWTVLNHASATNRNNAISRFRILTSRTSASTRRERGAFSVHHQPSNAHAPRSRGVRKPLKALHRLEVRGGAGVEDDPADVERHRRASCGTTRRLESPWPPPAPRPLAGAALRALSDAWFSISAPAGHVPLRASRPVQEDPELRPPPDVVFNRPRTERP